jgi:hypothetical protein
MRVAQQSVLGAGKTPNWAGAPHLWQLSAAQRPRGVLQPRFEALPARTQDSQIKGGRHAYRQTVQIVERKYQLEDLVADAAEQYAGWIGSTTDQVINSAVKTILWRDKGFLTWRKTQDPSRRGGGRAHASQRQKHDPTHPQLKELHCQPPGTARAPRAFLLL